MSLASNAKWNAFSQLTKMAVQIVNLFYLAKIIPPEQYGIMAMAVVIMNLGILLRDLGTSAAIIQKPHISHSLINSLFWLNIFLGLSLAAVTILLSSLFASIYNEAILIPVLILLSLTFPLSSCAATHLALLERESEFKKISRIEVSSAIFSLAAAILMANYGFGVFSLVAQAVIINLFSAIQFWFSSKWRPTTLKLINIDDLKDVFGFSANLSLFNFINYFSRNADSFLIGKYMSAFILGSYNLAYRVMLFPLQSLSFIATRSLYPILSRYQNDNQKLQKTYLTCVFFILMISAPLMTGIALLSQPFVYIFFGDKWYLTADILKWLAPTGIVQSILSTTGAVFMAKGQTRILMKLGLIGAILQVGSFLVGINFSIHVFAICYLIANVLNFFPVMITLLTLISSNLNSFIKKMVPIIISTTIMASALLYMDYFIIGFHGIKRLLPFGLICITGFVIYSVSLLIFSGETRSYIRKLFKSNI